MAPRKSKADGEEKGKSVVPPSTRTLRSMDRKTRSGHSASSSKLVSLEDPEKKGRKTTAKQGGGATKKIKKEEEAAVKVEKEEEPTEDDAAVKVEKDEEPTEDDAAADDDSGRRKIVIEHCKQCNSFKMRANQVKKGLGEDVLSILVTLDVDKVEAKKAEPKKPSKKSRF